MTKIHYTENPYHLLVVFRMQQYNNYLAILMNYFLSLKKNLYY